MEALRVLSDLISRSTLASRAGITFNGARDLYTALGFQKTLGPKDFRSRYQRNGIAARVVEAAPKATWRGGAELIEDEDPNVATEFEETWKALEKRLNIWSVFSRADTLAGLGKYAIVLIGTPGEATTPMGKFSADQLLYLSPFAEDEAIVDAIVEKTTDSRFGLPEFYQVKRLGPKNKTFSKRVHWSRVLHVADEVLDDMTYGTPRLERIWNDLDNLDKVVGGGSEAYWLRVHQGLFFNVDKELDLTDAQVTKTKEEMDEFMHHMRRTMLLRGTEVQPLGSDVSNFDKQVDSILTLIAGATGIPKRILMGSERGELASTQDRENWETKISDRRMRFAEPFVVRPFIDKLIEFGALPDPTEYEVRWPEIESLTELERGDVAVKWSGLNAAAGGTVVMPEEIRDRVLRLEPLTDEQLAEIEEKEEQTKKEKAEQLLLLPDAIDDEADDEEDVVA